jgi:hypothetical protein
MNEKPLSLYDLIGHPFTREFSLIMAPNLVQHLERFSWRLEDLARKAGAAVIWGNPDEGKSAAFQRLASSTTLCTPDTEDHHG